jgi:hypothetical protein
LPRITARRYLERRRDLQATLAGGRVEAGRVQQAAALKVLLEPLQRDLVGVLEETGFAELPSAAAADALHQHHMPPRCGRGTGEGRLARAGQPDQDLDAGLVQSLAEELTVDPRSGALRDAQRRD